MANSNASSFWSGLILGVIGTALVAYLINAGEQLSTTKKDKPLTEKQKKSQQEISFKFYEMLPELEVVVPEDVVPQPMREALKETNEQKENKQKVTKQAIEKIKSIPGSYFLQTGSFRSIDDADRMKAKLSLLGFNVSIQSVNVNGTDYQRVRVGPFVELPVLEESKALLSINGYSYLSLKAR